MNYDIACVLGGMNCVPYTLLDASKFDIVLILLPRKLFKKEWVQSCAKNIFFLEDILNELITYTFLELPAINFKKEHSNVNLLFINYPIMKINEHSTDREKNYCRTSIHQLKQNLMQNKTGKEILTRYDIFGYKNKDVLALLQMSGAVTDEYGVTKLIDNSDPLINIKNGFRQTAFVEGEYTNTIWCIGTCIFFGIGAPFDKTIESYLQKLSNSNGHRYKIENVSQFFASRYQDAWYLLNKIPVKAGDIVLFCAQNLLSKNFPSLDVKNIFDRPHDYGEVFADDCHLTEIGNKVMASHIWNYLENHKFVLNAQLDRFIACHTNTLRYGIPSWGNFIDGGTSSSFNGEIAQELAKYKLSLKENSIAIGAIVMNCNPFTLGHRYLIEYASSKVSHLYVFVVEEDKSFFPFSDRLNLVKKGTSDLSNVTVLPSGRFMISSLTFEDYFNKSNIQDKIIDPSFDVKLFGKEIAPVLGINFRFAGAEPLDAVTAQYNQTMASELEQYGIKFVEIPRKEIHGMVISASRVRKLLEIGDFKSISELVPPTTLDYLKEHKELLIKDSDIETILNRNILKGANNPDCFSKLDYVTGGFDSRFISINTDTNLPNTKFSIVIKKTKDGYGFIKQTKIPIVEGKLYTLSCLARGTGMLRFAFDGTTSRNVHDFYLDEKNWKRYSFNYVKSDGNMQTLWLQNYLGNLGTVVEVCDITLYENK